ncbi:MAG: TraR/DksA C4-type zinc finger protein [Bacteroidales bacterium]|jgi:DnaK suppressor protein|nr:TraR/DksA C4-type zinc finger protein [Bacteroidales bacterium]|tara:strand:+ start:2558 stop:2887 length:330 start_codon:yes stop_codon:yes gene_type:complete
MEKSEKSQVEEYLFREKEKLNQRVIELVELTKPIEPDDAIGRVSRMDAIVNKAINQEALKKVRDRLNKVNISLERINDDDFGTCIRCKKAIPIQRLLLMPGSLCIACAI